MANSIPRAEHPNPQFERESWLNLNGEWEFEIDNSVSGRERGLQNAEHLSSKIIVPFCPESRLSGVENTDFMNCVWYRRDIEISESELEGIVVLHFGAVDYDATVYINGEEAMHHKGGYVSFAGDITKFLKAGKNSIAVEARDDVRNPLIPRGKQSERLHSHDCDYTRTTGIWQTVWVEFVPKSYIKSIKLFPNPESSSVAFSCELCGSGELGIDVLYEGKLVGRYDCKNAAGCVSGDMKLIEKHLWEVGCGRLYNLVITFGGDTVKSYFGLRDIRLDGFKYLINGKSVFQRLVLDQGFYRDGIYTAPDDSDMIKDIEISLAAGFNGARLHQKVFEQRFLYHCDRLGYLVWGEHANWGLDISRPEAWRGFLPEWREVLERDYNHPAIIGWCPLNETQKDQNPDLVRELADMTRAFDPDRIYIDASGWTHQGTLSDIFDVHDYDQNPETFRARYLPLERGEAVTVINLGKHVGKPPFVSEFGGIWWNPEHPEGGWGYGNRPQSGEEFIARYRGLVTALLENRAISAFCYTQLTDVEQEVNGLYTYDRHPKFPPDVIRAINTQKAAVEE